MWTDIVAATNGMLLWLAATAIAFIYATSRPRRLPPAWARWAPWLAVGVAVVARLAPALLLPVGAGYDVESFQLVADAWAEGQEIYAAAPGRHPYLPLQLYLVGVVGALARVTGWPFVVWLKLPAVAADAAITAVLYHALLRAPAAASPAGATGRALTGALLYALNPIAILVTAYHGQFDPLPALLMLLAWWAWRVGRHRWDASALLLGLAILSKTWPAVLLPVLGLRLPAWRARLRYATLAGTVPLLFTAGYILVFRPNPAPMLRRALTHSGVPGYWGHSALLAVLGQRLAGAQALYEALVAGRFFWLAAAALVALYLTRRQPAAESVTTLLLTVFAVTPGMGIQWLLWPLPLAIVAAGRRGAWRWLRVYSLVGATFLLAQLYGLHMYPWLQVWFAPGPADALLRLSSVPAWLVVVAWLAARLRSTRRAPAGAAEASPS